MNNKRPSYGPTKCPNHGEPLEGIPFPHPEKGSGTCPVSGAKFDYEAQLDEHEMSIDKFGNIEKKSKWKLTGND